MKLGFIGFGEAAFEMSNGLYKEGLNSIVAFDALQNDEKIGELVRQRAETANVEILNSIKEVVNNANLVIVAVPADKALGASQDAKPYLNETITYVDVSASSPNVKKTLWETIKETGVHFVDGAMLGPMTVHQHKVPMIISGSGAGKFKSEMSKYGMNPKIISENPGDASAVKLTRSIYMKGTAGLLIEMLEAARALNVEEVVIESVKETMGNEQFERVINQLVNGTAIHAQRRSKEIEGSIEMLKELNIHPDMSKATKKKLEYITQLQLKEEFHGKRPENWEVVIDKMNELKQNS